jgi:hypothetical protein
LRKLSPTPVSMPAPEKDTMVCGMTMKVQSQLVELVTNVTLLLKQQDQENRERDRHIRYIYEGAYSCSTASAQVLTGANWLRREVAQLTVVIRKLILKSLKGTILSLFLVPRDPRERINLSQKGKRSRNLTPGL